MKIIKYFLFLLIFFAVSCSLFVRNNKEVYFFDFSKEVKEINIPVFKEVVKYEIPYDTLVKYEFTENDDFYVLTGLGKFNSKNKNKVYLYEINKKTGDIENNVIRFKFDLKKPKDYGYINSDSVFILYSPSDRNFFHDSILFLMNNKGVIKKIYSFGNAPVLCKNNPQFENDDTSVFLILNLYEPFNFKDDKLFMLFKSKTAILGDPAYEKLPVAGYLDTKTEKFTVIPVDYPDIIYGKTFFPSSFAYFYSVFGDKNKIIYAFKYTPKVIEYNYKTGKQRIHTIKSEIYDTIFPALNDKDVPNGYGFELPFFEYFRILYDKYHKQYYREVFAPQEYGRKRSIIIADSSFNIIAEGFVNQKIIGFTKDYIVTFSKSPNKGKVYLTFNTLDFKKSINQELIAEIKANKKDKKLVNKPITHYINKNTKIRHKNYTTTFMYYEMCPKTRDFVLGFYQFNKEKFGENQIYLVLITENINSLKNDLKRYNLLPENNPNIIIDSTYAFASYNGNKRNDLPRIIKVRNNKVVTDTIFDTKNKNFTLEFQKYIIKSGKEQKDINR